jgi:hypothetical protein
LKRIQFRWQQENSRFVFRKGIEPVQLLPYTETVVSNRIYRALSIVGYAANCTTNPRPSMHMTAYFDNVFTD